MGQPDESSSEHRRATHEAAACAPLLEQHVSNKQEAGLVHCGVTVTQHQGS